jgi:multidrug efflux pump subunit AcrA (membrane-fusion protein)
VSPGWVGHLGVRRVVVGAIVTVVVLAGGAVAWAATGASAAAAYRSAIATRGSVQQTLTATGTVTPRKQADVSFGTAGTVRDVDAAVGDHVDIGQTLAVLDRTALRDAVISAKAAVAKAKATLVSDRARQAAAVTAAATTSSSTRSGGNGSSASGNGSSSGGGSSTSGSSAATRKTLEKLAKEQAALLAAQHDADAALQVSAAALKQQATACAGVLAPADPATTPAPQRSRRPSSGWRLRSPRFPGL